MAAGKKKQDQWETCERCQGNGEVVTDWDRYLKPHPGDAGDEAVAECTDCNGDGQIVVTQPRPARRKEKRT
jgi:RecJ-like exonuclease